MVIKDSRGNTLGSGTAGDDGTFSIGISPAKINGETLSISVTDKAANSGPVETLNAPDKTAPAAPDGLIVATDGLSVSGQAEAGATVTIRDSSNTVLGSAVANGNGQFIVPLNTAQTNGGRLSLPPPMSRKRKRRRDGYRAGQYRAGNAEKRGN